MKTSLKFFSLKQAIAESICATLVEYYWEKNIQLGGFRRLGFDGAASFSGDKT